ncbi:RagB/SusD family nutrient uptake outer membrane protein [Sphingobacterium sp. SGG-5]|uniref:RagB/SusD family nutrient uptake outer membrane protein n=1 Tax=Sphingobacterium sp. SGG-5 TaxID=2710881 RepID=UPI0013EA1C23|nr:RagB/SusD family nutrient uptake outer membrane protein [Sphingobacterium sp. SGG-5]NGM63044.1 RagB/SusD family nutrient uptake outer membrane protein [Sphingobacterium sp. SGG-5]
MKYLMNCFLITCILVLFVGCNKLFDTQPEDFVDQEQFYQTEQQLNNALVAVYSHLGKGELYGGRMIARLGMDGDEAFYNSSLFTGVLNNSIIPTDSYITGFWRVCYEAINRANLLLKYIDRPVMSEKNRDIIKGEALFLRGYYYLLLTSNFGDVPLILEPSLSASQTTQILQTKSKDVYEQIITDMTAAQGMVLTASEVGFGGRINRSAVQGILSRVCLYMAGNPVNDVSKYEDARAWADSVITSGQHELNTSYSDVFKNYAKDVYNIKESILEVEFYGNSEGIYSEGGTVGNANGIRYTGDDTDYGRADGYLNITPNLWELYPDANSLTSPDLRRDWSIAPFSLSGDPAVEKPWTVSQILNRFPGKFRRFYEEVLPKTSSSPQNFPLLRYADVLLMYAEADNYLNQGPTPEALEAFNQVKRRAYGLPVKDASVLDLDMSISYADFLEEIKNERSRELSFECLRKRDLVRWGDYMKNMKAVYLQVVDLDPTSRAVSYFGNVTDRDVLWPIPAYGMGVNSSLVQNYGW